MNHALRTALLLRDGGCRFPGCGHTRFVHAHHVIHWAQGGATNLHNLITLCTHHHKVVHDRELTLAYGLDGTLQFVTKAGVVVAADTSTPPDPHQAREALAAARDSIEPTWCGERLDLVHAIDAILSTEAIARHHAEREAHAAAAA